MLRNGAKEIARLTIGGNSYVAAETGNDFVSWAVDTAGNCYWGHYFTERSDAIADMIERANAGWRLTEVA